MIRQECFELDWINSCKQALGFDQLLLERSIHALALLGHLADSGLVFVFKGGTSLLLHLSPVRRLSIDIDILCGVPVADLDRVLQAIAKQAPFTGYEEQDRGARGLPQRRHFKFFYPSPTQGGKPLHVLLDVVEETHRPPLLVQKAIRTAFIEVEREVQVTLPTIEGLLGDKLTAFAPKTLGVPYKNAKGEPGDAMQIVKQLFDVGELFSAAQDFAAVAQAYDDAFASENRYRGGGFTREQVLTDTHDACLALSTHELHGIPSNPDAAMLKSGVKSLASHVVGTRYSHDDARVAAARTALLTKLLLNRKTQTDLAAIRYAESAETIQAVKALHFRDGPFVPLNKIKAVRPEAFYYWHKANS